jgi:hypothetical protein
MRRIILAACALVLLSASVLPITASASSLEGDVNDDCAVNSIDLALVASRYGAFWGSLLYNPVYDLNHDRKINVMDVQMVAVHSGELC